MEDETKEQAAAPEPTPDPIEAAVWAWFNAHIPGSPVSQNVDAWNHLRGALPALVQALQPKGQ